MKIGNNTSTVTVVNTQERPVPVSVIDGDQSVLTPFKTNSMVNFSSTDTNLDNDVTITLPEGKRLVMENLGVSCYSDDNVYLTIEVYTKLCTPDCSTLSYTPIPFLQVTPWEANKQMWIAGQTMRLYTDEEYGLKIIRSATLNTVTCGFSVSGYLVNIP